MSIQSEINRIAGAKSDIADAIEDKGVTVPSGTKLDGMANLIGQISGGSEKLNSTQAADAYDPTATYAVGDKVSYAGNVYSCISAISTPEAWDSTHWDQVDPIQDQVDVVRNTLNSKADKSDLASLNLTGTTNTTGSQIGAGTYFYLNGALVKAKTYIANGATFTDGTNYEAITVGEEMASLGTTLSRAVSDVSIAQGEYKILDTFTLTPGNWLVFGSVSCNTNDSVLIRPQIRDQNDRTVGDVGPLGMTSGGYLQVAAFVNISSVGGAVKLRQYGYTASDKYRYIFWATKVG